MGEDTVLSPDTRGWQIHLNTKTLKKMYQVIFKKKKKAEMQNQ